MIENLPERAQVDSCEHRELDDTLEGGTMITRLLHLLEQLTGALLGSVGMSVLVGNVLVCIFLMAMGPAFVVELFTR